MPDKKPTARRIRKSPRVETGDSSDTKKPAAQANDTAPEIIRAMTEAVTALAQGLTNIASSFQERQAEHTQKYYSVLMEAASQDDVDHLTDAYQAVLDALASQDANQIADAQKTYADLLTKFMTHLTEHSELSLIHI